MTEKKKPTGKAGAVELTEEEAQGVTGGVKLTEVSLKSSPGRLEESRTNPKQKSIVQAYPAVE